MFIYAPFMAWLSVLPELFSCMSPSATCVLCEDFDRTLSLELRAIRRSALLQHSSVVRRGVLMQRAIMLSLCASLHSWLSVC